MIFLDYVYKASTAVSDTCSKNLPVKLSKKHLNKLVFNVGLFTRCNTRQMGKGEPNPVDHWEKKKDKLDEYQLPLGRFKTYNIWNFTTT